MSARGGLGTGNRIKVEQEVLREIKSIWKGTLVYWWEENQPSPHRNKYGNSSLNHLYI